MPQTVTDLGSFSVICQHPELLQTSPQEGHCQTSRRPGVSVCRCFVNFRGDDLTANNP